MTFKSLILTYNSDLTVRVIIILVNKSMTYATPVLSDKKVCVTKCYFLVAVTNWTVVASTRSAFISYFLFFSPFLNTLHFQMASPAQQLPPGWAAEW